MKGLKWIIVAVTLLILTGFGVKQYFQSENRIETSKESPKDIIRYERKDIKLSVEYCRPYKKGRDIFGALVPYNKVWRTGANEPSVFTTNQVVKFGEQLLDKGSYSIWTIPQKSQWTIILNQKIPDWGVDSDGKATRDPNYDVVKINIPSRDLNEVTEQFTMEFIYHVNLTMSWDKTQVLIPIAYGHQVQHEFKLMQEN